MPVNKKSVKSSKKADINVVKKTNPAAKANKKTSVKQVKKTGKKITAKLVKKTGITPSAQPEKKIMETVTPPKTLKTPPISPPRINNNGKRRLVVSYKNLSQEVLDAIKEKYPHGYNDYMADIMKVDKSDGSYFYAITIDMPDTTYLVKIDVKIDTDYEEVEKEIFGGGPDNTGNDSDEFPDASDDSSGFTDENDNEED